MDDLYLLLRFFHFTGFIFLGGGLLAVFVSEWRGYSATRSVVLAESAFYTAILYDFMAVPGALMMLITGPLLIWKLGYNYFDAPWLTGMWGLFLFEFIEGNTLTRVQFRRTLRVSRSLPEHQPLTEQTRREARTFIGRLAHFLDLPLFSVIIYCGVARPDNWLEVGRAIAIAIAAALALTVFVPRLAERTGALPEQASA
jgi:uncharacterized membrane protein